MRFAKPSSLAFPIVMLYVDDYFYFNLSARALKSAFKQATKSRRGDNGRGRVRPYLPGPARIDVSLAS
jgi:hypothetical protein